jgi:hypothetical protein
VLEEIHLNLRKRYEAVPGKKLNLAEMENLLNRILCWKARSRRFSAGRDL